MAIVSFNRKEIEKTIKLTPEVLECIMMLGIPVEECTADTLSIQVLPNRPDLLSMNGFLRALMSFLGKKPGLKKYKIQDSKCKLYVDSSLPKEWPYALACIIKNVHFDDAKIREIIQLQEKLGSTMLRERKKGGIGIYPLDNISFPVTFKGMHPDKIVFRPLESEGEMTGRQILSRHPTGRTYAHICSSWSAFPVFVDAKDKILSMPPILNSHEMGKISTATKEVFIEATGTDYATLNKVITILATSLAEAGGQVYTIECIQQNKKRENIPNLLPRKMKIDLEQINNLLGLSLKERELEKLLPKMGYDYQKSTVSIPAWRVDVLHQADIAEDILIAYGYDRLEPELPRVATIGEESPASRRTGKIAEILAGLGLLEISTYHLIKPEEAKRFHAPFIEVENAKTEYKLLRPNLLIPALRIFAENKDNEYPQRLFEIGTVFIQDARKSETGIAEENHLLVATSAGNFTEVKQILDYLSRMLGLSYTLTQTVHPGFIEGRTGAITFNNKRIGIIGELHPELLRASNHKMPTAVFELNLDELV
ncbi:phenylalanine--tRNA ligase subunit beta [Candidatus Pacearchaeota archaeon]|nr:phenylalanine--tRNA ligase subunit beta [Candidatus Pacearchaeota archaeon]